jgi:hypothetical protein
VVLLLRRTGGQDRRACHPLRQARHAQLHALRAPRRGSRHHTVELSPAAYGLEARARSRGRQHRGTQARPPPCWNS